MSDQPGQSWLLPEGSWPTAIHHLDACVYIKDLEGRIMYANQAMCELYNASQEEITGKTAADFVCPQDALLIQDTDRRVINTGRVVHEYDSIQLQGGKRESFWSVKVPLRNKEREIVGLWGLSTRVQSGSDITDKISGHSRLLGTLLESSEALVFLKDRAGRYVYGNERTLKLLGCSLQELIGKTDHDLLDPLIAGQFTAADEQVFSTLQRVVGEEKVFGADGNWHHFWTVRIPIQYPGTEATLLGFATEITELLQLRSDLHKQLTTDNLTGLANREQFLVALERQLLPLRLKKLGVAVVFIDLDEFKYINSFLGQEAGNILLRQFADRLRQELPASALLSRVGGDEFAFTMEQGTDEKTIEKQVLALRTRMLRPYYVQGRKIQLISSAGIALMPGDSNNAKQLLEHAETAMHVAKNRGRDQLVFYDSAMMTAAALRVDLENALRSALAANQFELHYQPKINNDDSIAGFEALLRWNRPGHGQVPPLEFISLAERLGLLVEIGEWVIREACKTMAAWKDAGLGRHPVAVNLSLSQLHSEQLLPTTRACIREFDIQPNQLGMEVTESMMMRNPERAIKVLQELVNAGVELSIDDFGTGYSSMAYLKLLPVTWLKLDRQFVKDVDSDPRDAALCAGIIALAHELGLLVVAEGVESREQQHILAKHNCEQYQGYLFSKPMPLDDATRYLAAAQNSTGA